MDRDFANGGIPPPAGNYKSIINIKLYDYE